MPPCCHNRHVALAAHCATVTERARFLGSANVARRGPDGGWHGDHVDGAAFVAAVRAAGGSPDGARAPQGGARGAGAALARALRGGAGGAGGAIALALLEAGVAELALHAADAGRRDALVARLRERFGD